MTSPLPLDNSPLFRPLPPLGRGAGLCAKVGGTVLILTVLLALSGVMAYKASIALEKAHGARHDAYLLAGEFQQETEDLTKYARRYAASGEPMYEDIYNNVIAIRNQKTKRPQVYGRIYWDLVVVGKLPLSGVKNNLLEDMMARHGFLPSELEKLARARKLSDALAEIEIEAINATKGLFKDRDGRYTVRKPPDMVLANAFLTSSDYNEKKAQIMAQIDEFYAEMDKRATADVERARADEVFWGMTAIAALITLALVGLLGLLFPLVRLRER